jgi:hypothetical protein
MNCDAHFESETLKEKDRPQTGMGRVLTVVFIAADWRKPEDKDGP